MFIGREKELSLLNEQYQHNRFSFTVVYGRRRVGKTALLRAFCAGKDTIFYSATEQNNTLALARFSQSVMQRFPEAARVADTFETWEKAIAYVVAQAQDEQLILVIDEYPYIAADYPAISSILQHLLDGPMQSSKLCLILCGSSMSFMEHQVLGNKSPLYGRRTAQLKVYPMNYLDSARFFPTWGTEDKLLAYMTVGGIPYYLLELARLPDFKTACSAALLRENSILFGEPLSLMNQEMRTPARYNSVIQVIAQGATKPSEMANALDETISKVSRYLATLAELGIVHKRQPYGEKRGKAHYEIIDPLFRFAYTFLYPYQSLIASGAGDLVYQRYIEPALSMYAGRGFEDIAAQYLLLRQLSGTLPTIYNGFGAWWGTDPIEKKSIEIDLVGADHEHALFAECKWQNKPLGLDVFKTLVYRSQFTQTGKKRHYCLFSKAGFTQAMLEAARQDNVSLVGIQELMGPV